uniref:Uncharacterized protein n=1 Tax=Aegilops tauschii subsp. strangulata TaxID=200361 RepID=A0A453M793_AEGTS
MFLSRLGFACAALRPKADVCLSSFFANTRKGQSVRNGDVVVVYSRPYLKNSKG